MALISSGSVGANLRPGPTSQKGDPMGLKEYDVVINGHSTTLQLSDEDAKLQGLTKSDLSSARADAKAKAAADAEAAEKERAEVEAKERAEADAKAKAEADAKAAASPANKGGKQPTNKQAEAAAEAFGAKSD